MTTMASRALARLRARITKEVFLDRRCDVWFYLPGDGVAGWHGTARWVMFVGLNPSRGVWGKKTDQRFYALLRHHGFARAHLTDVIKERATSQEVKAIMEDAARMRRYRRYLAEEIRIIKPRSLVALGWDAYRILNKWQLGGVPVRRLPHYASRYERMHRQFGASLRKLAGSIA